MNIKNSFKNWPDESGFYGRFGGKYVAETLMPLIIDVEKNFKKVKKLNKELIVINSDDIYENPKKLLKLLCKKLNIKYSNKMIKWPLGSRSSDGCWHKVWYETVKLSTSFEKKINKNINVPSEFLSIYNECLDIYNEINFFNLNNEYQ